MKNPHAIALGKRGAAQVRLMSGVVVAMLFSAALWANPSLLHAMRGGLRMAVVGTRLLHAAMNMLELFCRNVFSRLREWRRRRRAAEPGWDAATL
jgi:uncharacterized membrane protein (UPF0136 family)